LSEPPGTDPRELARLREQVSRMHGDALQADQLAARQDVLIERLRRQAGLHDDSLTALRDRLTAAETELEDLRVIRDALTPPELPERPGITLAASFLPATERVSGDFYLAADGPGDSTVLVVGDVVGKGLAAARRAAFVRTTFAATAPFSDDPCRLLGWANLAMIERAGRSTQFVTAACVTLDPASRTIRWALAGHPPPRWLDTGAELVGGERGVPLGLLDELGCTSAERRDVPAGAGVLLFTDGLTEARLDHELFGEARVSDALVSYGAAPPSEVVGRLTQAVEAFAPGELPDDLCLLSARMA